MEVEVSVPRLRAFAVDDPYEMKPLSSLTSVVVAEIFSLLITRGVNG